MGLTVLDNQFRIEIANDDLFDILFKSSVKSVKGKVLFQINKDNKQEHFYNHTDIYILNSLGIWFSRIENDNRFIYVFGVNEPKTYDSNIPLCTIDFSISGKNKNTNGVFAQDEHGNVSVLYRVNQQDLTLKSFELEFKGDWIQAQEDYVNNYFILIGNLDKNFLDIFKDFIIGIEQNCNDLKTEIVKEDQNPSDNLHNFQSCLICGKLITSDKSNYDSIISSLDIKNEGYCISCLEKIAAASALEKIGNIINLKIFNRESLLERVDDPAIFESYLNFLKELDFLKEFNKDLLICNKNNDLNDFIKIYNEKDKISKELEPDSVKKCTKCGVVLSSENSYKSNNLSNECSENCKDCSKKSYAVKALNHLEEYAVPGVSFNKDDLLKQVDNRTMFLDYMWTLQEFDLLEKVGVTDFYILKSEEDLIEFKKKFGDEIDKSETVTSSKVITTSMEKKSSKKIVKKCEICGQVLSISNFYKSSISDDGFTEKCKGCSRKSYAAKALSELKNYIVPDTEFFKEDLLNQADNRNKLLDYFWTLQEFDFIEYNEKNNTYILKPENEINAFIKQFGVQINETIHNVPETQKERKIVKKCKTCEQILPISDYYKSSESDDGFTENCKKCFDNINTANILLKIKKYIGIGIPFSKNELSNQLGNSTKVNYYIWTLQEHDLIDYDEKKDSYVVKEGSTYKSYKSLLELYDSGRESKALSKISTDSEGDLSVNIEDYTTKEIIYISEGSNLNENVILRGIIKKENLYAILKEIESVITINMTLNRDKNDLFKLVVELEINIDSYDDTLKSLEDKNWKII